ncbi:hypothetical protein IMZ48_27150 [Candidatus Bathyarchaeota archaeon]|nr:hypothetical protein [Candidatus Bathyarchaeota archaeon]
MPLDIVGEIANIDPAVLLRGFPDAVHSLFLGGVPFLERALRSSGIASDTRSSTWCSSSAHGAAVALVIVTVSG